MSCLAKAKAAWGAEIPEWVVVLAEECDRSNQRAAADRIEYSAATVSLVLKRAYKGDLTAVEQAVRGVLMKTTVECPVVGSLAMDQCMRHQKAGWSPHNPQRIAFYKACRAGCPNSRIGGKDVE